MVTVVHVKFVNSGYAIVRPPGAAVPVTLALVPIVLGIWCRSLSIKTRGLIVALVSRFESESYLINFSLQDYNYTLSFLEND